MRVLTPDETRNALPFPALVEALDAAFRLDFDAPLRHHHIIPNTGEDDAVLLLMPAWLKKDWGGVKLVNVVSGNVTRGRPSISSSYVLFDRTSGEHVMLLDGAELTARRTAAASALAASKLARPDSRTLLVVGAGRVGRYLPYAYRAGLPIERVLVFNRDHGRADHLVAALQEDGFQAERVSQVWEGASMADIISCATLAKEPILKGGWLRPGQHVDLIGSFTPEMREVDDQAIRSAAVYVDTKHALVESGDLATPLKNGILAETDIKGTLFDLCGPNPPHRSSPDEITLFKGVGSAIEDLAAAILAFESVDSR